MNPKTDLEMFHKLHPRDQAYKYQLEWASDRSKFKLGVKARQIGITTTEAIDSFLDCLLWQENEQEPSPPVIICCSPSQLQSNRMMEYVARIRTKFFREYGPLKLKKETEKCVRFDNHAEFWSLPNNPRTIEGIDASRVIIDEIGNFLGKEDEEVYEALMGSLAAKKGSMVVFGRPRGRRGLFWKLFDPYGDFASKFSIHIFDWTKRAAEDEGYKVDVLAQKEVLSPLQFASLYCCEFVDEGILIFPYEILQKQKRDIKVWKLGESFDVRASCYLGIDFAKKLDQTAVTLVENTQDQALVRFHAVTKDSFDEQLIWISHIIEHFKPVMVLVDETGQGLPMLDFLNQKFGSVVEGVVFSSAVKEKLVLNTKNLIYDGKLIIPNTQEGEALIDQMHGIEKIVLDTGRIKYTGKRTETDFLDDRFWATALACSRLGEGDWGFAVAEMNKPGPQGSDKPKNDYEMWARDMT